MNHLAAADPDQPRRRTTGRRKCPHCEATPGGCQGNLWLRGRPCCAQCQPGDHDDDGGLPDAAA